MRIAHHRHQLLDVNEADRVIEMTAAKRETRVARLERFLHVLFEALFDIEKDDFAPRRHDIAHHAPAKIERVHEQIAAELGNLVRFFALIENEPQFLFAVGQLGAGDRFDPQQFLQEKIRRFV